MHSCLEPTAKEKKELQAREGRMRSCLEEVAIFEGQVDFKNAFSLIKQKLSVLEKF